MDFWSKQGFTKQLLTLNLLVSRQNRQHILELYVPILDRSVFSTLTDVHFLFSFFLVQGRTSVQLSPVLWLDRFGDLLFAHFKILAHFVFSGLEILLCDSFCHCLFHF